MTLPTEIIVQTTEDREKNVMLVFQVDAISKELEELELKKAEKQRCFEEMICQQMETLKRSNEDVAAALSSHMAAASPNDFLTALSDALSLIPDTAAEHKTAFLQILGQYVRFLNFCLEPVLFKFNV